MNNVSIDILDDIDNFKLDPGTGNSTVIFGSSKTGKSTLMMHIYDKYYKTNKDFICSLFSINSHIKIYDDDGNLLKCNTFNDDSQKYILLQKYINSKADNKCNFLNMFDDIINFKYCNLINEMIMTYRNSNMSTIMCLQFAFLFSKMNRANANNIIIFGANSDEARLDLIKTFLKSHFRKMGLKNFDSQMAFFKEVTNDHGFIYIHTASDSISFHRLKI